ncbi:hypothetical protein FALBO_5670 [Fusarium albosuccineum]|uniref:Zn(2)-C6 fungal-type domain-containing protein n=1 Tax=Fusarium albosuccineum TaxID=1237068 RepID=A0A8H4LG95_9HYPO|nr:hypothetical protein FALBO_5670 [Fusarium albosuccineum]
MSGRVAKSKPHPKTVEASKLAEYIVKFGDDVMPCSRCLRLGLSCQIKGEQSHRCQNCTEAKVVCDGSGVASYQKNMKARAKLDKEEEEAEAALEAAMARLARIRKQRRSLKRKGDEIFGRGMRSQEESGELRDESLAISEAQSLGAIDLIDWNSILGDVPFEPVGDSSSGVVGH